MPWFKVWKGQMEGLLKVRTNQFQMVVARHHPSLYALLAEIQREQWDTEAMLRQPSFGQTNLKPREFRYQITVERIFNVFFRFVEFVDQHDFVVCP